MAPVNERPFLHYVFDYLEQQGCTRVILSLGYKHEYITDWVKTQQRSFAIDHVIEHEPLGTGGGIQLAMREAEEDNVMVLNGDTIFLVPLNEMLDFHIENKAATTIALKAMKYFDRYGVVNTDDHDMITSFEEKQYREHGYINGGIYCISKPSFLGKQLSEKFSFEKDYMEAFVDEKKFFGYKSKEYFIDIGIPSDYHLAQKDFKDLFE